MRQTIESLRRRTSKEATWLGSMIRRLVVSLSNADGFWNGRGYTDAEGNVETFEKVEVFGGIGFSSRPAADGRPEMVVLNLGAQGHPVAVATRDRRLTVTGLAEGETAIHNAAGALVHLKADGSIIVRAASGKTVSIDDGSGAEALVRKSDFDGHTHSLPVLTCPTGLVTVGSPTPPIGDTNGAAACTGTACLRGK